VYRNALVGTLPTTVFGSNSNRLTTLDVEFNQLTGPAFAAVSNQTQLKAYRISSNQFTGTIPAEFLTKNADSLTELWIANNQIVGTIPSTLGDPTDLTSLIMYKNRLTGIIPSSIGALSNLERLHVYDNALDGPLPPGLFNSNRLQDLRLEQNTLNGNVPTEIGRITGIKDLRMGENSFTGTLPSEIMALTNLGTCKNMACIVNRPAHTQPTCLSSIYYTVIFTANATGFTGPIINAFTSFRSLEFVDLASNKLMGTIPDTIFTTPIEFLYLSDNMLTGTIPSGFANAADLSDLYLFNNALTGTVPAINAGQLTTLSEFRIENNAISGTMPASICALRAGNSTNTTTANAASTGLVTLISDCGGPLPQIRCECCNSCVTSP
jgi:Leucine-rich repeat (LRR) protein